jgi:hypothetical protein
MVIAAAGPPQRPPTGASFRISAAMELTRDELTAEDATVPLRWARGLRLGSANPDDCFDHLPIAESHDRIGDVRHEVARIE